MMAIATIVKKELKEIIRDKTSLIILLIPFFLFPALSMGLEFLSQGSIASVKVCVVCDDGAMSEIFYDYLDKQENYTVVTMGNQYDALNKGDVDCLVKLSVDEIDFIFNKSSYLSLVAATELKESFEDYYYCELKNTGYKLYDMNLLDENNEKQEIKRSISNIVIPILFIMMSSQSTVKFANDLFAGEKERNTLEILFLTGVKRSSIFIGKTLALVILSINSIIISLISFILSYYNDFVFEESGADIVVMLIMLFLLSVIAVVLSLTVSLFSNSVKTSQIINDMLLAVLTGIAVLLSVGYLNISTDFLCLIPIVNSIVVFNEAFFCKIEYETVVMTIIINVIMITVFIITSVRYLKSEKPLRH